MYYVVGKCCILDQTLSIYSGGLESWGRQRFQWLIKLLKNIKKLIVINYCSKIGKHLKTLKNTRYFGERWMSEELRQNSSKIESYKSVSEIIWVPKQTTSDSKR